MEKMPTPLADVIRATSEQAEHNAERKKEKERQEQQALWEKAEQDRAAEIIAKLPAILEKAAKENHQDGPYRFEFGYRKYQVLTLNTKQGGDGKIGSLRGAAATIRDWAIANGFGVALYLDIDSGADWSGYLMYIEW